MKRYLISWLAVLAVNNATAVGQTNEVDALAERLKPMLLHSRVPCLFLPSNATPTQVVASAVNNWGFGDRPQKIKEYQIRQVRKITIDASEYTAAFIASDLGDKILLFKYDKGTGRPFWWTRFFDAEEYAEQGAAKVRPPTAGDRP